MCSPCCLSYLWVRSAYPVCVISFHVFLSESTPSRGEAATITLDKDALGGTEVEFGDALEAATLIHAYGYLHHLYRMQAKHPCPQAARTPLAFLQERGSYAPLRAPMARLPAGALPAN